MSAIRSVLNYTRALESNASIDPTVLVTYPDRLLLLEWGHFVPLGTNFIETNCCVGFLNNTIGPISVTFDLMITGPTVSDLAGTASYASAADPLGERVVNFKSIIPAPNEFVPYNSHIVFQLYVQVNSKGTVIDLDGPLNASTVSYGIPS